MNNSNDILRERFPCGCSSDKYLQFINTQDFKDEIAKDINIINNPMDSNLFFRNHADYIQRTIQTGQLNIGISLWLSFLESVQNVDSNKYYNMHKGVPYYHAGILSLLDYRYTEGFMWIDYALNQDIVVGTIETDEVPSKWILSFNPREGKGTQPNDFGVTRKIRDELQNNLANITAIDSTFSYSIEDFRDKILNSILTSSSKRAVRAAWSTLLSNLMSHKHIVRLLVVGPRNEEIQLTSHKSLLEMTLIFETLLKECPNATPCGVLPGDTLGRLISKIIPNKISGLVNKKNILIDHSLRKDFRVILNDIKSAERTEDKRAVAITVSLHVRNHSHHLFNQEEITKEVYEALFTRISYAIILVLKELY